MQEESELRLVFPRWNFDYVQQVVALQEKIRRSHNRAHLFDDEVSWELDPFLQLSYLAAWYWIDEKKFIFFLVGDDRAKCTHIFNPKQRIFISN